MVRLHEIQDGKRFPCDGCIESNETPLCIKYCVKKDELKEIILEYRRLWNSTNGEEGTKNHE